MIEEDKGVLVEISAILKFAYFHTMTGFRYRIGPFNPISLWLELTNVLMYGCCNMSPCSLCVWYPDGVGSLVMQSITGLPSTELIKGAGQLPSVLLPPGKIATRKRKLH